MKYINLKHISKSLIPLVFIFFGFTMTANSQSMLEDEHLAANYEDFTLAVTDDLQLTPYQERQMTEVENETYRKIGELEDQYKVDSDVYINKVHLLNAQKDKKMRDVLTLEQYAIYLNNSRQFHKYNAEIETDEMSLKRDEDGNILFKDEIGKIKINDDKFIIKNDLKETKLKVKQDKIKFKNDPLDKKIKIKEDKVVVKTDGKKVKIEPDEVEFENDDEYVEIKMEDLDE